jgi:hypothetical protein
MQQQLGHSSIELTVDTYRRWLKMRDMATADRSISWGRRTTGELAQVQVRPG